MIPVKGCLERLGVELGWYPDTKKAVFMYGGKVISIISGEKTASVNGII